MPSGNLKPENGVNVEEFDEKNIYRASYNLYVQCYYATCCGDACKKLPRNPVVVTIGTAERAIGLIISLTLILTMKLNIVKEMTLCFRKTSINIAKDASETFELILYVTQKNLFSIVLCNQILILAINHDFLL
ncbi:hypothetical protein SLEP1_g14822 [Rubroshorea leprosula]|uniref:Uncharacterized protein n=1 Tax=Rubroshorea leprosula TaxID=152421 RepID=A0AAV5IRH2_9ROSI|nr:hypothetical protein SLEP1_g14822 [Rubroshorea leprosula]